MRRNLLTALCVFLGIEVLLLCGALHPAQAADKLGVAIPYSIEKLDPLLVNEPVNRVILANTAYGLTALDKNASAVLTIAEQIEASADMRQWTIVLRHDARFASLRLATPEAVRSSFDYLKRSAVPFPAEPQARSMLSPAAAAFAFTPSAPQNALANLDSIESAVNHSLIFRLHSADPGFLKSLALFPIVDAEVARAFEGRFGYGTNSSFVGPYVVRQNQPKLGVLLERSPSFFRAGRPIVSVIDFHYFEQAEDALRSLRVGSVDIILLPTPAQLADLAGDPTVIAVDSPLINLSRISGPWQLRKDYWSRDGDKTDSLVTTKIIVRKTANLDDDALSRFDLSGSFLP